jgi:predicted nuclease of predicted toxin-antitoxin system
LLVDENLSPRQAVFLRAEGHDAVAVSEAGLSGEPDEDVRRFVIGSGRVLLTLDADFGNLLRFPTTGTPGVIRLRIHPPPEEATRELISTTMNILRHTSMDGCLAISHGGAVRIRR